MGPRRLSQLCFTNGPKVGVDDPFDICNPPATGGADTCERYGSLGVATGQSIVPNVQCRSSNPRTLLR